MKKIVVLSGMVVAILELLSALPALSNDRATAIRICNNGILYRYVYDDGTPNGGSKTDGITPEIAQVACRGVVSVQQAKEVRKCVNGLLYRYVYDDGTPNGGSRTDMSPMTAAQSCAIAQAPQPSGTQAPQPSGNVIIVIPQTQPQSQPVQRRSKQVCVNTTFNQIWDNIHCQFNNGMFEWRTIYLD